MRWQLGILTCESDSTVDTNLDLRYNWCDITCNMAICAHMQTFPQRRKETSLVFYGPQAGWFDTLDGNALRGASEEREEKPKKWRNRRSGPREAWLRSVSYVYSCPKREPETNHETRGGAASRWSRSWYAMCHSTGSTEGSKGAARSVSTGSICTVGIFRYGAAPWLGCKRGHSWQIKWGALYWAKCDGPLGRGMVTCDPFSFIVPLGGKGGLQPRESKKGHRQDGFLGASTEWQRLVDFTTFYSLSPQWEGESKTKAQNSPKGRSIVGNLPSPRNIIDALAFAFNLAQAVPERRQSYTSDVNFGYMWRFSERSTGEEGESTRTYRRTSTVRNKQQMCAKNHWCCSFYHGLTISSDTILLKKLRSDWEGGKR